MSLRELTGILARRARTSAALRRVRSRVESHLPLAAPVLTHLIDRPLARMNGNGHDQARKPARPRRKNPLAMAIGFSIPIGDGRRGPSRLHIRTLLRLER